LPCRCDTWLGYGHSIPNGHPAAPYAHGTRLSGAVLVPPVLLHDALFELAGSPPVHFWQVLPVTKREMRIKLKHGIEALLCRLEAKFPNVYGPISARRKSAV
jgi:Suppressor of fused protein (SUFU)